MNNIIVCPICKSKLLFRQITKQRGIIQRAELHCTTCNTRFKVYARIPVLLSPGQLADWTHPFIEALFGNIKLSYEELIAMYGIEKIRELYFKLINGEYKPPRRFFKEPVNKKLLAESSRRITIKAVEKHFKRIKEQTRDRKDLKEMIKYK